MYFVVFGTDDEAFVFIFNNMILTRHIVVPTGLPNRASFTKRIVHRGKRHVRKSPALTAIRGMKGARLSKRIQATSPADTSTTSTNHAKTVGEEGESKYAALHDFCMTIPYGVLIAVVGLCGCIAKYGDLATAALIGGLAICLSSYCSLRAWRANQSNTRYTLASAGHHHSFLSYVSDECLVGLGLAIGVGSLSWRLVQGVKGKVAGGIMMGLSVALTLFLIYNLAAGGNPPKKAH